ncbi:LysE/ArgO family amino acid transporter [Brevibacillus dissolubilis]|uniref:LysE/ArgO family amino acid transporter n=1 Tax=Brevibacillus dissolubilis TaxID=1844116 RepID=UPI001115AEDD|nr:LysE/ArgO family amino acid transporter [Brevibacillus dissolubilis]
MTLAFLHGVLLAFGLILPLGVQNVFVFNQGALQKTFSRALPVILTASLCDTLLISLAVLGVSVVVLSVAWLKTLLIVGGVIFLFYMGWNTWKAPVNNGENGEGTSFSPRKQIAYAASVSLLNPHAILDTIGVIGTSSLAYTGSVKLAFALACILISWLWFIGLALAGRLTGKLDKSGHFLYVLNKISALVMWAAAIYLII